MSEHRMHPNMIWICPPRADGANEFYCTEKVGDYTLPYVPEKAQAVAEEPDADNRLSSWLGIIERCLEKDVSTRGRHARSALLNVRAALSPNPSESQAAANQQKGDENDG